MFVSPFGSCLHVINSWLVDVWPTKGHGGQCWSITMHSYILSLWTPVSKSLGFLHYNCLDWKQHDAFFYFIFLWNVLLEWTGFFLFFLSQSVKLAPYWGQTCMLGLKRIVIYYHFLIVYRKQRLCGSNHITNCHLNRALVYFPDHRDILSFNETVTVTNTRCCASEVNTWRKRFIDTMVRPFKTHFL